MSYLYKCIAAPRESEVPKEAIGKVFSFVERTKDHFSNGVQFVYDDMVHLYSEEIGTLVIPDNRLSYYFEPCAEKEEIREMDKEKQYESEDEMVSHPSHYQSSNGVECIDAIKAATENLTGIFATDTGNIIKYAWRWNDKGTPIRDVEKIIWYATHLLNELKNKQ